MDVDVTVDDGTNTYDGCIRIDGLHGDIRIPHIIKMLESASLKLQHPAKCRIQDSKRTRYCTLQLKSKKDAQKFIDQFNGKIAHGQELTIKMNKPHPSFSPQSISRDETCQSLLITNLPSKATDQQLMEHIQKQSKKIPQSIRVQHHSKGHPAMAFVEMASSKEAQTVMKKVQMSKLGGQQMWIQQSRHDIQPRNEHLKGLHNALIVQNVPMSWRRTQIREMCAKHGEVKEVTLFRANKGYLSRDPLVIMSTEKEASALFDALNGKKVEGCVLRTFFQKPRAFRQSAKVKVVGLGKKTSVQKLINHIKKNTSIDIEAKDIWMYCKKGIDSVQIGCSNKADALELANALNLSELNGSKIVAEVPSNDAPKGSKRKNPKKDKRKYSKLKKQKGIKSDSILKWKVFKMDGLPAKDKLSTKGKNGKGRKGGKQKKKGGIKKTVKV